MRALLLLGAVFLGSLCLAAPALAAPPTGTTDGFRWADYGTSVTITGCASTCPATLIVPATLDTGAGGPRPVTRIGTNAFTGAPSLTSISLPDSVTSIDTQAFMNTTSLANIALGNGVITIGDNAFSGARSLTSITIPNSVTTIDYGAFSYSGLTSITIPNSVTSIGDSAFYEATSLKSITIPTSGVIFGDSMFYGASSLKRVLALGNAPDCTSCTDDLFSGAPATLCRYPSASGWPAMNALYFGIPQADLSTSACAESGSTSSGTSTGSTTKTATGSTTTTPTGSMTARTRCAASGLCTTTGTVPAGTEQIIQTATSSKSQIVKTTCTISKKTSFVCKLRLGPGSWRLTPQAKIDSKTVRNTITYAKLKTKRPTAVTG